MACPGILGRKIGMTQIFDKGIRYGVTVVEAGPCKVLQVKNSQTDGYDAVQLGFGNRREKTASRPILGHCDKAGSEPKRYIKEIRLTSAPENKVGDVITTETLAGVKFVDVTGISKGKGFQGVMKRHNFHGLPASHGCSKRHRSPGGLGRQFSISKGVPKGKKMAGHMGSERVTIQALEIVKVIPEQNLILILGAVPGAAGSFVMIRKGIREKVIADSSKRMKFDTSSKKNDQKKK